MSALVTADDEELPSVSVPPVCGPVELKDRLGLALLGNPQDPLESMYL